MNYLVSSRLAEILFTIQNVSIKSEQKTRELHLLGHLQYRMFLLNMKKLTCRK